MGRKGFTLLELLIVVIIVGILAAVAIPQFTNATDRSRESEGRAAIDALLTAESAYYQDRGTFTTTATELLASIPTMRNWLTPVITQSGGTVVTVSVNGNTATHNHSLHFVTATMGDNGSRTIANNQGQ